MMEIFDWEVDLVVVTIRERERKEGVLVSVVYLCVLGIDVVYDHVRAGLTARECLTSDFYLEVNST